MKINRKLKPFVVGLIILVFLTLTGVVLKNIFLHQVEKRIQTNFNYARLYLSLFPPALVVEEARSLSLSPFFSAKKIAITVSLRSLLTKEKPIRVFIEHPVLRIYETSAKVSKKERTKIQFPLPFSIQRGLVRKGEIFYWGREDRFRAEGFNALFFQRGDRFSIKAEAEEGLVLLSPATQPVEGRLSIQLDIQGKDITVEKFVFHGKECFIKAEGHLHDLFEPEFRLKAFYKLPANMIVEMFGLPFSWEGKVEGEGVLEREKDFLTFKGDLFSERLLLGRAAMGKIRGQIEFEEGSGGRLQISAQKKFSPKEFLEIRFHKGRIWGKARGFYLNPLMMSVSIPYPISSPFWGNFSIERGNLQVEGEFRDEIVVKDRDRFPMNGSVRFRWKRNGEFSFSSASLDSTFAHISIDAEGTAGDHLDMRIQGEVKDLVQARHFTSLILARNFGFPEIRGKGQAEIHISGDFSNPEVEASFDFSPGGFGRFDVDSVRGQSRISEGKFFGKFDLDGSFIKGKITLFAESNEIKAGFQIERGLVERILPLLDIPLPLEGEASGDFEYIRKEDAVELKGNFQSPLVKFDKQKLEAASGKIEWKPDFLSLRDLRFSLYRGKMRAELAARPSSREFDLDIEAEEMDLAFLDSRLKGKLFFNLEGKGHFDRDKASGHFKIHEMEIPPLKRTEVKGQVKAGYVPEGLSLKLNGNFFPGENEVNISFIFPFNEKEISAESKGSFTNLDLLLPWSGAKGRVSYLAEINDLGGSPRIRGVIDFKGSVFPFPRFAQALQEYSGLVFVENNKFTLRYLRAKLGGGDVQGFGEVMLGRGGVESMDLRIEGRNMLLSPLERTRALTDGTLHLIKDPARFLLQGEFQVKRLTWRREIYEKIAFSSRPYYSSQREPGFFDDLTLNIRIKADDNAWMDNSLGRLRGRFDLTIGGSVFAPVLLGDIEVIEGDVYFQDRKFEILRGGLSFFNPSAIEPYLNFKGETYVKNYRVIFSLTGFIDRLNPELSSSPPLPPEDVLALLAMGEAFKRTYSYDRTTQLSSASLLSLQLSEEAKKRAEKLFSIDRFRITPFILGSSAEMTARLTIGKKIARDFSILYSTNLTTQREELARIEWEMTDDFSIVGTRDEKGRLSIDIKVHKRF